MEFLVYIFGNYDLEFIVCGRVWSEFRKLVLKVRDDFLCLNFVWVLDIVFFSR